MKLYIKIGTEDILEIETEYDETIKSLKEEIYKKTKIPQSMITLIYAGRIPYDDRTIARNNIQKESYLYLVSKVRKPLNHIFVVKNEEGDEIKLNVMILQSSLIEDIKFRVQDDTGIPYESIQIFYEGNELDDNQSIIDIDDIHLIEFRIHDSCSNKYTSHKILWWAWYRLF